MKRTMLAAATEYRETLAIELAIANDPVAREAWLNRQLSLDPVDVEPSTDVVEDGDLAVA